MEAIVFLKPLEGLLIRDPINKDILPPGGAWKPVKGAEGKYWNRRLLDGSVYISSPEKKEETPSFEFKHRKMKGE